MIAPSPIHDMFPNPEPSPRPQPALTWKIHERANRSRPGAAGGRSRRQDPAASRFVVHEFFRSRTRIQTVARALAALTTLMLVVAACGEPIRTLPDPSSLKAPAKDIVVTDGNLRTPYEILGLVEATLGGLSESEGPAAAEAAKRHLRDTAYTQYGDRLDAIIKVKTTPLAPSGPFGGWFNKDRGLRAEGVAVTFPPPPPPPKPADSTAELTFSEAVNLATDAIVDQFRRRPGSGPRLDEAQKKPGVVIDPMIDGASGQQTAATRLLEQQVAERLARARFDVLPFRTVSLSTAQYLMTGTLTRVEAKDRGAANVFRVNLALVDMKTGTIIARASSRTRDDGLDTNPTAYYRDSPIVVKDRVVDGYIRTAETSSSGGHADPTYFERVTAAALIGEALAAYNGERYQDALALYRDAAATPAGEQLRALNGVYLATWKLGRTREAEEAFGRVVAFGLRNNNLGVKFLFNPGTTEFWSDPKVSGPYAIWLRQIARQAVAARVCLTVVGHASRTGSEAYNDDLSERRAKTIKKRLETEAPELGPGRIRTKGMGFRENIIGTGTDDARDALDRRVEFKVTAC
jgi:outer membrane protein OmpA-like peptidoglycan-associated protein